jgi:hypothetical protein
MNENEDLKAQIQRLLAELERSQSDRDEALARLQAAKMEVAALGKYVDQWIRREPTSDPQPSVRQGLEEPEAVGT